MKKLSRIFFASALLAGTAAGLASCDVSAAVYEKGTPVKVGLICLHDSSSTYDKNFIDSINAAVTELGAEKVSGVAIIKTGVDETNDCYIAARDLVKQGCNVIFADSFGHEPFMLKAAQKWPTVTFAHATGTQALTANTPNYHNAFASIYEGRYLAGVAAGIKLQSMIANDELKEANYDDDGNIKLGYIGAFPYAEVVSGYTSWFLGVRSIVPGVAMDVTYTSSWYDFNKEETSAQTLINGGAALISQHADSMGAPGACEKAGVPNVSYNISTATDCPTTYIAHSRINWAPYYKAVINSIFNDTAIEGEAGGNYTGTIGTGSVEYEVADPAIKAQVDLVKEELVAGTRKVFDCSKFTVNGETVTSYKADVEDDGTFTGETEAIKTAGGITYFDESAERSAPYFDLRIDGIKELN